MPVTNTWTSPSSLDLDSGEILPESYWDALVSNTLYLKTAPTFDTSASAPRVLLDAGTAAAPALAFTDDPNTGVYGDAADGLLFSTGGTFRWSIASDGDLNAGTDNSWDVGQDNANRPRVVYAGTAVAVGSSAAGAGAFRMANAGYLYGRNNANNADLRVIGTDAADTVQIGNTTGVAAVQLDSVSGTTVKVGGTSQVDVSSTTLAPVAARDNALSCGASGQRWTAVWAVNGTIQTSSRDAKDLYGRVDPAAALAAVERTPLYAYAYKGDDPVLAGRQHVGFVAEEADPLLCPDGATASPNTTASIGLAAIQALAERCRALEERVRQLEAVA